MRYFRPFFAANRFVICVLLAALVLLGGISVFFRYFLNAPIFWSEELMRFLGVWLVLLGTGDCAERGMHVAFDLLQTRLDHTRAGQVLTVFINVVIILFGLVLVTQSVALIEGTLKQESTVLRVPMAYMYLSLPICGLLVIMGSINQMLLTLKEMKSFKPIDT